MTHWIVVDMGYEGRDTLVYFAFITVPLAPREKHAALL